MSKATTVLDDVSFCHLVVGVYAGLAVTDPPNWDVSLTVMQTLSPPSA